MNTLESKISPPEVSDDSLPRWSKILLKQHSQLSKEINAAHSLLNQEKCTIVALDVHLKKLIKGIVTHLELESFFLFPALTTNRIAEQHSDSLSTGFKALYNTCTATQHYLHSLKVNYGSRVVNQEQISKISHFLTDIAQRLNEEDPIYSQASESTVSANH